VTCPIERYIREKEEEIKEKEKTCQKNSNGNSVRLGQMDRLVSGCKK
jgi:hypothetical protein